jgi:monoamine oxidase
MREDVDVVVVGAGVAGLAAGAELEGAGRSVQFLEARDRVGGRILTTRQTGLELPVELGAEFVHGGDAITMQLAASAGAVVAEAGGEHWRSRNGAIERLHGFWKKIDEVMSRLDPGRDPDRPVIEALPDITGDCSDDERQLLLDYIQGFHAADPMRMGERALAVAEGAGEDDDDERSDRQLRILSGYDRIVSQLAIAVPDRVQLGAVVERVEWSRGDVRVKARVLQSGRAVEIRGRALIVTAPLGVLQARVPEPGAIAFDPAPTVALEAAARLDVGSVVRLAVRLREPIWSTGRVRTPDGDSLARMAFLHADGEIPVWWTPAPVLAPLLIGWCGGPPARELAQRGRASLECTAIDELSRQLHIDRAELEREIVSVGWHDWDADPFARGAYSYVPVGALEAQRTLSEPVDGTLFFAGEACAVKDPGTVHGAIESGREAGRRAAQILRG